MKDLNKNIIQSIYWNYSSSFIIQSISILTSIVLVKLLSPNEFGAFAITLLIFGIGSVFIGQGYSRAIIREKCVDNRQLSTIFWINAFFGFLVVILSFVFGSTLERYFEVDNLSNYLSFFSFVYFMQAINVVQLALLERQLNFRRYSIIHIYAAIISSIAVIIMAMAQLGVYSLLWRGIIASIIVTVFVWYKSKWKPTFIFSYQSLCSIHAFSRGIFGTRLLNFTANQLDNFIVAKLLGSVDMGIYNRAKSFTLRPVREIHSKTRNVAYSALSKIENDLQYLNILFKFTILLNMVIIPLLLIIIISSDTLIYNYLSEEWYPLIDIMKLIALGSIIVSSSIPSQILMSKGKSNTLFKTELINSFIKISILLFAFKYVNLVVIVGLFLAGKIISSIILNIVAYKNVKGFKTKIWKYHLLPIVMAFSMFAIAQGFNQIFGIESIGLLLVKLAICLPVFGAYFFYTYPEIMQSIKSRLRD